MNTSNDLHRRAMDMAALALMDRMHGNTKQERARFERALDLELAAIAELEEPVEPTFSVLHRSAATLALDCNQFRRAEQLVATALAHEPPPEIADELRDLLEQVYFQRHLEVRGVVLREEEFQLSLSGPDVGFGFVSAAQFQKRIGDSSRLIHRIAERKSNRPFRERGRPDSSIVSQLEPYLSLPRAASYAVTLRFGRPRPVKQLPLPGMVMLATEVLNEFMDLIGLLNDATISDIRKRIPQSAYLANFLGLARNLAPDGDRIHQVGFTTITKSGTRFESITKPKSELPSPTVIEPPPDETTRIEIRGTLRYAESIEKNRIKIIDSEDKAHTIAVPEGMMNDIVRPMWDSKVRVIGLRKGRSITLQDIQEEE